MAGNLIDILIKARDEFSAILQSLDQRLESVGGTAEKTGSQFNGFLGEESVLARSGANLKMLGQNFERIGKTLSETVTGGLVAASAAAIESAHVFEEAMDHIAAATGRTGDALDALEVSLKNVTNAVPNSVGEIGSVLASLTQRTQLTGKSLEDMAVQILNLSRLTGTSAAGNVATLTRMFGAWGISTEKQSSDLDFLFKVTQQTGIQFGELSNLMQHFSVPMKQLGFDFEHSAALMGLFEKEGVNTQMALMSMQIAIGNFARRGISDTGAAMTYLIERIKTAGTEAKANSIGLQIFGARAGPQLVDAIRSGRLSVDELVGALNNSSSTINKTSKDTESFGEKLLKLKNQLTTALQPLGKAILDSIESWFPVIEMGIGKIKELVDAFTALPPAMRSVMIAGGLLAAAAGPTFFGIGVLTRIAGSTIQALAELPKAMNTLLGASAHVAEANTAIALSADAAAAAEVKLTGALTGTALAESELSKAKGLLAGLGGTQLGLFTPKPTGQLALNLTGAIEQTGGLAQAQVQFVGLQRLTGDLKKGLDSVKDSFMSTANAAASFAGEVGSVVGALRGLTFADVMGFVKTAMEWLTGQFALLLDWVANATAAFLEFVASLGAVVTALAGVAVAIFGLGFLDGIAQALGFADALKMVTGWASEAWKAIKAIVGPIVELVYNLGRIVFEVGRLVGLAVGGLLLDIAKALDNVLGGTLSWMASGFIKFLEHVVDLAKEAAGFLGDVADTMHSMGRTGGAPKNTETAQSFSNNLSFLTAPGTAGAQTFSDNLATMAQITGGRAGGGLTAKDIEELNKLGDKTTELDQQIKSLVKSFTKEKDEIAAVVGALAEAKKQHIDNGTVIKAMGQQIEQAALQVRGMTDAQKVALEKQFGITAAQLKNLQALDEQARAYDQVKAGVEKFVQAQEEATQKFNEQNALLDAANKAWENYQFTLSTVGVAVGHVGAIVKETDTEILNASENIISVGEQLRQIANTSQLLLDQTRGFNQIVSPAQSNAQLAIMRTPTVTLPPPPPPGGPYFPPNTLAPQQAAITSQLEQFKELPTLVHQLVEGIKPADLKLAIQTQSDLRDKILAAGDASRRLGEKLSDQDKATLKMAEDAANASQMEAAMATAMGNLASDFAKAITDMIFQANTFGGAMKGAFQTLGKSLTQVLMLELFAPLQSAMKELGKAISEALNGKDGQSGPLGTLNKHITSAVTTFSSKIFGDTAGKALGQIAGAVAGPLIGAAAGAAIGAIVGLFGKGRRTANEFVQNTQNPFGTNLENVVNQFYQDAGNGLITKSGGMAARDQVVKMWTDFQTAAAEFAKKGGTEAKVAMQALATMGPIVAQTLNDMDGTIGQLGVTARKTATQFQQAVESIEQSVTQYADNSDVLEAALEDLVSKGIPTNVILKTLAQQISDTVDQMTALGMAIPPTIEALFEQIDATDALTSSSKSFADAVKAMIDSVTSFADNSGVLEEALKQLIAKGVPTKLILDTLGDSIVKTVDQMKALGLTIPDTIASLYEQAKAEKNLTDAGTSATKSMQNVTQTIIVYTGETTDKIQKILNATLKTLNPDVPLSSIFSTSGSGLVRAQRIYSRGGATSTGTATTSSNGQASGSSGLNNSDTATAIPPSSGAMTAPMKIDLYIDGIQFAETVIPDINKAVETGGYRLVATKVQS